jgi:uncharacterized protein YjbJ (UPF0337 family)
MNSNQMEGQWNQVKGHLKAWWGKLTDDDIGQIAGNKDKLVGMLQEKYGYLYEEALGEIDRRLNELDGGGLAQVSHRIKERAREAVGAAADAISSNQTLHSLETDAVELIRRYPLQTLLLGLAIGFLFARGLDRSR